MESYWYVWSHFGMYGVTLVCMELRWYIGSHVGMYVVTLVCMESRWYVCSHFDMYGVTLVFSTSINTDPGDAVAVEICNVVLYFRPSSKLP